MYNVFLKFIILIVEIRLSAGQNCVSGPEKVLISILETQTYSFDLCTAVGNTSGFVSSYLDTFCKFSTLPQLETEQQCNKACKYHKPCAAYLYTISTGCILCGTDRHSDWINPPLLQEMHIAVEYFEEFLNYVHSPCANESYCEYGGVCSLDNCIASCECPAYRSGSRCEIDVDECESEPCENGGTCLDAVNHYTCECPEGYEGTECEVEIDECASSPCVEGQCFDDRAGYLCACNSGFMGTHCNENIDDCEDVDCHNGTCIDGVDVYLCTCYAGFQGSHCEEEVDECDSSPCVNGVCRDRIDSYVCDCETGYMGTHCEDSLDECSSDPCINGQCVDDLERYVCLCSEGFTGTNCDSATTDLPTRLEYYHYGRIELQVNGQWGSLCGLSDPVICIDIICPSLGFTYGISILCGVGSASPVLSNALCFGTESNLGSCTITQATATSICASVQGCQCSNDDDNMLQQDCGVAPQSYDVYLSQETFGIVYIYYNDQWGTVCDDYFDWSNEGCNVVCRQRGFTNGIYESNGPGDASMPIHLDDVWCTGLEANLDECSHNAWQSHNCYHGEDIGCRCYTHYDVSLSHWHYGTLTVSTGQSEGHVGTDVMQDTNRGCSVVCKQQGFEYGIFMGTCDNGQGSVLYDGVSCTGDEQNIGECNFVEPSVLNVIGRRDSSCRCCNTDINCSNNVDCTQPSNFDVFLDHGTYGIVYIYHEGHWGTVCSETFDQSVHGCTTICRGFQYTDGEYRSYGAGDESLTVHLEGVFCYGTENNLDECFHYGWGNAACDHSRDAGCLCFNNIETSLAHWHFGLVTAEYSGAVGTVCDNTLSSNNHACQTICIQQGFEYGIFLSECPEGQGSIILSDVGCQGGESNLGQCNTEFMDNTCVHVNDAGCRCCNHDEYCDNNVDCTAPSDFDIFLSHGSYGIVYVYYAATWGTMCDDYFWDNSNGCLVVCLQNGYRSGSYRSYGSGISSFPILLDDVFCTGSESNLDECYHLPVGSHNCGHHEDAGCECYEHYQIWPSLEYFYYGILTAEIASPPMIGTVCDDYSDMNDIACTITCNNIGFEMGVNLDTCGYGNGDILLDNVQCAGSESQLGECTHADPYAHDCNHYEDVACKCCNLAEQCTETNSCEVPVENDVFLTHGSYGMVYIYHDNVWGTICDDFIDNNHNGCTVVCRQKGYGYGVIHACGQNIYSQPIWLDDVVCTGSEANLAECQHLPWGSNNCYKSEDIFCRCCDTNDYCDHLGCG